MVRRNQCRRRRADRKTVYVLIHVATPSDSKPSPLMLTVRDMMINAGVIIAPKDVVDAVRDKIEYFKKVA